MVVDDNEDAAESLAILLRRRGHAVHVALDGERGLEAASEVDPEVVLLDFGLPDMDGLEVARRLRASPRGAGLRIVALTGRDPGDEPQSAALFDAHVQKPIEISALVGVLEAARSRPGSAR